MPDPIFFGNVYRCIVLHLIVVTQTRLFCLICTTQFPRAAGPRDILASTLSIFFGHFTWTFLQLHTVCLYLILSSLYNKATNCRLLVSCPSQRKISCRRAAIIYYFVKTIINLSGELHKLSKCFTHVYNRLSRTRVH